MKHHNEYGIRYKAIHLYEEGHGFEEVLRLVRRSRGWLSKWLKRYKEEGIQGLKDKCRVPKRIKRKTSNHLVKKILAIREELESHKTRRSAFAGIGAEAIHWELTQRGVRNIPSISTISRILFRHGKTGRKKMQRNNTKSPYPYMQAQKMGELHQTDLVGPRYLRGTKGITRFYSFHTVDVAGHTAFTSQFSDKQTISLCRHIWLKLGDRWEYLGYLNWIMKWLPQEEAAIPLASLKLSVFICSWASIWFSFHRENRGEMPRLRVLMNFGRNGYLGDITAQLLLLLEEPVNAFCVIIITRNLIGHLLKKNMVHDSQGYLEIELGNISDVCQKDSPLIHISTPLGIFIFLLLREKFLLFEKLILMGELRSMALHISLGENLKDNMWWLLLFLRARDWSLNKTREILNRSLFLLRVMLLLHCWQKQKYHDLVHDVMRIQSIKNQFTML